MRHDLRRLAALVTPRSSISASTPPEHSGLFWQGPQRPLYQHLFSLAMIFIQKFRLPDEVDGCDARAVNTNGDIEVPVLIVGRQ